jgi:antitoxin YefM
MEPDLPMKTVTYTAARATLAQTMDEVTEDHAPVLITRQKGEPVVMMSLADYEALEETAYLLRSPANAERLLRSMKAVRAKKTIARKLLPDDEAEG